MYLFTDFFGFMSHVWNGFIRFLNEQPQEQQQPRRRRRPSVFREKSDADLPHLAVKYKNGLMPVREDAQGNALGETSELTKFLPHTEATAIIDME